MVRCEFIDDCGFFRNYGSKRSPAWQGLFSTYCCGELVSYCERWKAYRRDQRNLDDNIMPCGEPVPEPFTLLL